MDYLSNEGNRHEFKRRKLYKETQLERSYALWLKILASLVDHIQKINVH